MTAWSLSTAGQRPVAQHRAVVQHDPPLDEREHDAQHILDDDGDAHGGDLADESERVVQFGGVEGIGSKLPCIQDGDRQSIAECKDITSECQ